MEISGKFQAGFAVADFISHTLSLPSLWIWRDLTVTANSFGEEHASNQVVILTT